MSFDFSTLVTDRTQADVNRVKQIAEKIKNGTASESELAEFNSAAMKGAYNYTDLNRVTAAMEALKAKLEGYGYAVPGYQRIQVPHPEFKTSRLPEGYTELVWIESTGTQYVDTGFVPNQDTRVDMETMPLSVASSGFVPYGAAVKYNDSAFECYTTGSQYEFNYGGQYKFIGTPVVGQRLRISHNKNNVELSVDGATALTLGFSAQTFTAPYTLTICGSHRANVLLGSQRIYSCQIYDDDFLMRDFVPCINPDGEVGLYDLVTKAFFGNSGTGAFVAGAMPGELLPYGYTQVEYIQSSGTQYIDTGVAGSVPLKVELELETLTGTSTVDKMVMASTDGTNSTVPVYLYNGTWFAEVGKTGGQSASGTLKDNTRYNVVFDATSAKYSLVVNNATLVEKTGSLTGSTKPLFLFARNNNGTASHHATAKVHGLKMYSNSVLVRDFVPCKNASGVVGLYDVVSGVFYQNVGSGTFTAGNEVASHAVASVPVAVVVDETEYDQYTWYEFDWPTPEVMTLYLLNVTAIRSVLAVLKSTPKAPVDVVGFMTQEANDIETILLDVYAQLLIMPTTFVACGEALCGGDNL